MLGFFGEKYYSISKTKKCRLTLLNFFFIGLEERKSYEVYERQVWQSLTDPRKFMRIRERERGMRERRMCGNPIYVLKGGEWWAYKRKTQHMLAHGDNGPPPKP